MIFCVSNLGGFAPIYVQFFLKALKFGCRYIERIILNAHPTNEQTKNSSTISNVDFGIAC